MRKILPIMIVKGHSCRLKGKNIKPYQGKPLFQWNLERLLNLFGGVVVDSDSDTILDMSSSIGAKIHKRDKLLLGDETPSVPIFQSILNDYNGYDGMLNVQANSPNTQSYLISRAYDILVNEHCDEIITCYSDGGRNGSIWGVSASKLYSYNDFFCVEPDVFIVDDAIDIHTQKDFDDALKQRVKLCDSTRNISTV
jgi:hypothetical protein